jgi:ABC-type phosphate/phosphonate transport system substrate-binding protein
MTIHDDTIVKIQQLPETMIRQVNDFIDALLWEEDRDESEYLDEGDFADYLSNLEDYENRLANGEIKW